MSSKLPIITESSQPWRSEAERRGDIPSRHDEFREGSHELTGINRRTFMSLMGATVALAGTAGCRRPEEKILPYAHAPEGVTPGVARYYASALAFAGTAVGVLVESHEGRPTKIEGNPRHPHSLGGTNTFLQAMVLDLYDPDRSIAPRRADAPATREALDAALVDFARQLADTGGGGYAILTEAHRSPTLARVLKELRAANPNLAVHRYDPFARDEVREGARLAFGRALEPVLDLARAKVIVALDADLFTTDGSPIKQARGFAEGRELEPPNESLNRLYAIESRYTITGASADHRLPLPSRDIVRFAAALAHELAAGGLELGPIAALGVDAAAFDGQRPWVKSIAADLLANRGASVLTAGAHQPAAVHALVNAMNAALGNVGKTVEYVAPFDADADGATSLAPLAKRMAAGALRGLLILGGNPAFDAPADLHFTEALAKVPTSIHLSYEVNETSAACTWHAHRAHPLESWGDLRADDGTAALVQPLIAPLFDGRTDAELVSALSGSPRKAYELVRATWQAAYPDNFEHRWRQALHDGLWESSAAQREAVTVDAAAIVKSMGPALATKAEGLEVTFAPCSHTWDGRFANNGWLQELPDPLTKLTWDNAALVSEAAAARLGVRTGDLVNVSVNGSTAKVPVVIAPGQADESVALSVGMGRRRVGRVGAGAGVDVFPLRTTSAMGIAGGASVTRAGGTYPLSITQEHHAMEGRPQIRAGTLAEFRKEPEFAKKMSDAEDTASIYGEFSYAAHKWGMVIDLNRCIGCNACMVACQAENNIPIVGKTAVANTREMHWIRVDRYFEGEAAAPRVLVQPVTCQQCEIAPCESVCPVGATTHSPEGLNDMAYNRCIGTRYCANNCPFKVRRFNFLHYNEGVTELRKMQFNPEVTVRGRGVMEKCTYCVQRVNHAKIAAHREGRDRLRDGEVHTACQQGCPTQAISFGDLNDPKSEVARRAAQERDYVMLAELNIRPRTSYLARIRNPNPALEPA